MKSPPERRQMKDIAELNTHVGVHSPDTPPIHTSVTIPVLVLSPGLPTSSPSTQTVVVPSHPGCFGDTRECYFQSLLRIGLRMKFTIQMAMMVPFGCRPENIIQFNMLLGQHTKKAHMHQQMPFGNDWDHLKLLWLVIMQLLRV